MTNTATLIGAPSSKEEAWRYTPVKDIATRVQMQQALDVQVLAQSQNQNSIHS